MAAEQLDAQNLHALVVDCMETEPRTSFEHVLTRLRAREGRGLANAEVGRLREIYEEGGYGARASKLLSDDAAQSARLASLSHSRPNRTEIAGCVAGLVPMFVHLDSTTLFKQGGVVVAGSYFDLVAVVGGMLAVVLGISAALMPYKIAQRPFHYTLIGIILSIGFYQSLLGLGMLHRIGLYQFN